jgi:Fe-S cluster assembly iron-binding protein IscA
MLTLTDTAADVVKQITEIDAATDDAGLRISTQAEGEEGPGLVLSAAPAPEDGDQVLADESGARVFLDESAAVMLDDKVLDAQVGADGSVQFAVGQQG